MDYIEFDRGILRAAREAEATYRPLDPDELSADWDIAESAVTERIDLLSEWGLLSPGDERTPAQLRYSGQQYLEDGHSILDHDADVLWFMPTVVDDLIARRALLEAGTTLLDGFRAAILSGHGAERARGMLPTVFAPDITARVVLDLYASGVALMARLSAETPPGSVGEELLAYALVREAKRTIADRVHNRDISANAAAHATQALRALPDFFAPKDEPVNLFDVDEVCAIAPDAPAEERLKAWFRPFESTVRTGYLRSRHPLDDLEV